MSALSIFVILYMVISIGIGVYAAMRVRNSTDYILAGRSLPIYITMATERQLMVLILRIRVLQHLKLITVHPEV